MPFDLAAAPTTTGHRRRARAWTGAALGRVLPPLLACALVAGGWEAMARHLANPLIPDTLAVFAEARRIVASGEAAEHLLVTLGRIGLGFAGALTLGLAIGFATARSRAARAFFEPLLVLGLTIPGLVWALLAIIWFGVAITAPVSAIILGVAPALAVSFAQGFSGLDRRLVQMAAVFRFPLGVRLRRLWLPAVLPFVLSGGRVGFSLAWKVIVLVELFGLSDGVGYRLNAEFSAQNVAGMLAWTGIFWAVMAGVEYGFLRPLERHTLRWRVA